MLTTPSQISPNVHRSKKRYIAWWQASWLLYCPKNARGRLLLNLAIELGKHDDRTVDSFLLRPRIRTLCAPTAIFFGLALTCRLRDGSTGHTKLFPRTLNYKRKVTETKGKLLDQCTNVSWFTGFTAAGQLPSTAQKKTMAWTWSLIFSTFLVRNEGRCVTGVARLLEEFSLNS